MSKGKKTGWDRGHTDQVNTQTSQQSDIISFEITTYTLKLSTVTNFK